MLHTSLLLLALAAEPQCPTDWNSCMSDILPDMSWDWSGARNDQICNTTTWMLFDYCYVRCPMRLIITEPPELRMWICLYDNIFQPYAPDAHIDLYHRLNNLEMDIEAVGHPSVGNTRQGCEASDYGNKSFTGKIAMGMRGLCEFTTKAQQAQAAGSELMVIMDNSPWQWDIAIWGSSEGIESFPTLWTPRNEADYVFSALDRGVKVRGKFQYECNDVPEDVAEKPEDYPWDRCPWDQMALADTCTDLKGAQEPLCEVCTVELQLPGAEKLCLFGNYLLPRKQESLIHTAWELPYTAPTDEVVYLPTLPNEGCSVSDFAGLAGKIVLVPETGQCTLFMTVISAQEAGAKAYILVSAPWYLQWYAVLGLSHQVRIPVHTVDYHTTPRLQAFIANGGGREIPGVGYSLDAMTFTRGEAPATDPPTQQPLPPMVVDNRPKLDTSPDFEMSAGIVVCLVVVCVDVVVIVLLFVQQHRDAVHLPAEVRLKTFSIPLKVASMGLSLTLLLLIAIVSFSLTWAAGQDSTDKAMDNGRAALGLAYDSSEKNTLELSDIIRSTAVDRVIATLQTGVTNMEDKVKVLEAIFFSYDGSWAQLAAHTDTLFQMSFNENADNQPNSVITQIFTTRGFFVNHRFKTDDRPDSARKDGVLGSVAETGEGWRYGVNEYILDFSNFDVSYIKTIPSYTHNASRMVAGNIGDPLAVTSGLSKGFTTVMVGKLTFPVYFRNVQPITVYRPLYSANGQYHGTIEAHMDLHEFVQNALDAAFSTSFLQNLTVLLVDIADKTILGQHGTGTITSRREGVVDMGGFTNDRLTQHDHFLKGLYSMYDHPAVNVTALTQYLDSVDGWVDHDGLLDQKDYFTEQPHITQANIVASGGKATDTSLHNWDVEMRDGACGACVAYDDQLQKEVLVFDGMTTLHVYRNMTRRTPVVAKSQVSGPGEPWRSRHEVFADTLTHADGTECVAHTFRAVPTDSTKKCMVRTDITNVDSYMVSMRIRPDIAYPETSPRATTPRLFSDSLVGDANIRLFANGQLYLFVLRFGCRTDAYPGGFPVHAWTTVTAVVGGGFCRVYVNGTLHSEGHDARWDAYGLLNTGLHGDPYLTGQFFRGRMDSLQLFSDRLLEKEVASLHTAGRLVRDVPSKQLFVETKSLNMNGAARKGVQWTVAVMIPRIDIMRVVDANRRKTLADVQVQEDNTHKELTQKANDTIMVIVVIAMTSVVAFLVFNNLMTRPFEETAAIMAQAAVLRIDSISPGTSLITELGTMNIAIGLMLQNLKLYKSFMPQSVQLDDSSTECALSSTKGSLNRSGSLWSRTSSRQSASSASASPAQMKQLQCSLVSKKFTFLAMNIRNWHGHIATSAEGAVIELHSTLIDFMMQSCIKQKGVNDMFSGDRFACSFNAAKAAAQHKALACTCALECSAALKTVGLSMSCSAVSGDGRVGNIGNTVMRRFSFLTPLITWGYALERFACGRGVAIVIDPAVYADAELLMTLRLIDAVTFPKMTDKNIRVYELISGKAAVATDEWMYQLEAAAKNDPMKEWNACAECIVNEDFEVWLLPAVFLHPSLQVPHDLNEIQRDGKPMINDPAVERLVFAWKSKKFDPCQINYH